MNALHTAPLENFLRETIGLAADSLGRGAVERAARKRMADAGCDRVTDYVDKLRRDERLRQQLIEELVVPETWFFRDQQPFALLARLAVKHARPVRVLSMPCSTGEEPYSIAMALLGAGLAPDAFCIDAVDISGRALALARQASYGTNSFRGEDGSARDTWFKSENGRWQLDERVRSRVTFHQANLFEFTATVRYDFIFCRNLLIYFDAPMQSAAATRLLTLLQDDGVLFVGHAEAAVLLRENMAALPEPRTFAFVRKAAGAAVPSASTRTTTPVRRNALATQSLMPPPFSDVKPRPATVVAREGKPVGSSLAEIQELADRGQFEEALKRIQVHINEQGPAADSFCLLGVIHEVYGQSREAETAYRKALYLEPKHEEAVTHLALMLEKRGDPEAARLWQRIRRSSAQGGSA